MVEIGPEITVIQGVAENLRAAGEIIIPHQTRTDISIIAHPGRSRVEAAPRHQRFPNLPGFQIADDGKIQELHEKLKEAFQNRPSL